MKHVLLVFLMIFTFPLFADIDSHLMCDLQHVPSIVRRIDAVFLFKNAREDVIDPMMQQLEQNAVNASCNEMFTTHSLPNKSITKYCSQNISPELLAQIINHLSIYKYSLEKGLSSALIVEARSTLRGKFQEIEIALDELSIIDPGWDILFVNQDYCSGKNGEEHITPQVMQNGGLIPNKEPISTHLSKLLCRYGCSSYVISSHGMRKILNFFQKNWLNLPLDQAIFQVPDLNLYTVNKDIIINGLFLAKNMEKRPDNYITRENYSLGDEFWIDPAKLLSVDRFDILIKYLYTKHYLENTDLEKYRNYYLEHIKGWNNFYEGYPLKVGPKAFLNDFHKMIHSLQSKGYDPTAEAVPINNMGDILNGAHRVGICLALGIPLKVKVVSVLQNKMRESFAHDMSLYHQVSDGTMNHLVCEYVAIKSNTYALINAGNCEEGYLAISQYVDVVYFYEALPMLGQAKNLYIIEVEDQAMMDRLAEEMKVLNHEETIEILQEITDAGY